MANSTMRPHVLIFPLPLQGPVNAMVKLAELLCLSDLHVTLLVTDHIHDRLLRHSDIQSRFNSYPGFRLLSISDGLPADHPRQIIQLFNSLRSVTKPLFKQLLVSGDLSSDGRRPISCIISDGSMGFSCDVANEVGVPIIYIRTISACCLWVFLNLHKLIEAGEIPFSGTDLDVPIQSVPGTEGFLRRRDLPGFCRAGDVTNSNIELYKSERDELPRAYGLILNTFEELEGPMLSQIRTVCPNLYTIGPLHSHLKTRLSKETKPISASSSSSNSLWKEDMTCVTWLDSQPLKSVIYISFGSLAVLTHHQLLEFWHGVVNSRVRFLWVIRPDLITGGDWESQVPEEVKQGTKERGYIVEWAPQEVVLAHPAVGGFWTHAGWNSTLESVIEGVPMLCWPYFLDQQVNSRFVDAVWNLGLDMKDVCDRNLVSKMVNDLMVEKKDKFWLSTDRMAIMAKRCLIEGGSSYCNFERLVKDIESMSCST